MRRICNPPREDEKYTLIGRAQRRHPLEDLGIDGKLNRIDLREAGCELDSVDVGYGVIAGICECRT
jgi:hypothetical protein